jgi:hypothetical protein
MIFGDHRFREIVEEEQFLDEKQGLDPDPVRADEFIEGAVFVLSRNPKAGKQVGEHVWFLPMAQSDLGLFYTFDNDHVYLLSLQRSPEESEYE